MITEIAKKVKILNYTDNHRNFKESGKIFKLIKIVNKSKKV